MRRVTRIVCTACGYVKLVTVRTCSVQNLTLPPGSPGLSTPRMGRVNGAALPFVWGANALGPIVGSAVAAVTSNVVAFPLAALFAMTAIVWILTGGAHRLIDDVPQHLRIAASPQPVPRDVG